MQRIKITDQQKQLIMQKIQQQLDNGRFSDGKIKIEESLDKVLEKETIKPVVYFSPVAWLKMRQLVNSADGEIGWHGVVDHIQGSSIYTIKDIVLYPQTVTGVTVTTDALEYSSWLMHFEDAVFNKIRFQGHSHVNMTTSPSGVDLNFYDSILQNLAEDDYYIFMIVNKRNDMTIIMYDFAQNVMFNEKDISVRIACKNSDIQTWADHEMRIKVTKYTAITSAKVTSAASVNVGSKATESNFGKPLSEIDDDEYEKISKMTDTELTNYYVKKYREQHGYSNQVDDTPPTRKGKRGGKIGY